MCLKFSLHFTSLLKRADIFQANHFLLKWLPQTKLKEFLLAPKIGEASELVFGKNFTFDSR